VNGNVRVIAYLYIVFCGAVLAAGTFLCLGLLFSTDDRSGRALATIGVPFLILSVVYFIPGVVGGIGLLRGKASGRVVITILSVLMLLLIPVGTVLGGYTLWLLHRSEPAVGREPLPPLSPGQKSRYAGLLAAMAFVASGFIVAIGTGFRVTRQPAPAPIGELYYPAIIVLVATIAMGVRKVVRGEWRLGRPPTLRRPSPAPRRDLADERRRREDEQRLRIATLAADPARRKYVELIERGEWWWTDEQIEYNEDPSRLVTCVHLQPIEREMRGAGIAVRIIHADKIHAACCIDHVALGRRFALPPSVHYSELPAYDRSLEDPPLAVITCDVCRSVIDCMHRYNSTQDTRWFPAA
jgi:hypothetical protein